MDNNNFLTHEQIMELAEEPSVYVTWDFDTAWGDTIKEKYESLYCKLVEINNILIAKGAKGYFWIATSPVIGSIFETTTMPLTPGIMVMHQGGNRTNYIGNINNRWKVYINEAVPVDLLVMGARDDEGEIYPPYATLTILNLIT